MSDPDDAELAEKERDAFADDLLASIEGAAEGAIGASKRPGLAYIGLTLAAQACRKALIDSGDVTEEKLVELEEFAAAISPLANGEPFGLSLVQTETKRRKARTTASHQDIQRAITAGADVLSEARNLSPSLVSALVAIRIAARMGRAVLEHFYPAQGDLDEQLLLLRAMDNMIPEFDPANIEELPPMSKGGTS